MQKKISVICDDKNRVEEKEKVEIFCVLSRNLKKKNSNVNYIWYPVAHDRKSNVPFHRKKRKRRKKGEEERRIKSKTKAIL